MAEPRDVLVQPHMHQAVIGQRVQALGLGAAGFQLEQRSGCGTW